MSNFRPKIVDTTTLFGLCCCRHKNLEVVELMVVKRRLSPLMVWIKINLARWVFRKLKFSEKLTFLVMNTVTIRRKSVTGFRMLSTLTLQQRELCWIPFNQWYLPVRGSQPKSMGSLALVFLGAWGSRVKKVPTSKNRLGAVGRAQNQPHQTCPSGSFNTAINEATAYYYFTVDRLQKSFVIKK